MLARKRKRAQHHAQDWHNVQGVFVKTTKADKVSQREEAISYRVLAKSCRPSRRLEVTNTTMKTAVSTIRSGTVFFQAVLGGILDLGGILHALEKLTLLSRCLCSVFHMKRLGFFVVSFAHHAQRFAHIWRNILHHS
eukprot:3114714-Amphidinium_carterae.2